MSTDAPARERTLPNNQEAERTVLGAILVDNAAFNSAASNSPPATISSADTDGTYST